MTSTCKRFSTMISPPTTTSAAAVGAPATEVAPAPEKDPSQKQQFGRIILDISNSVLPDDKLMSTPSSKDGLPTESELQIRSLACDLVQIAGKLLKIPQVRYVMCKVGGWWSVYVLCRNWIRNSASVLC